MDGFDISQIGNIGDSLNNLNSFIQNKAKENALNLKNNQAKQIENAIAFKNSQSSIIERIKSDAQKVKSNAPTFSQNINSYIKNKPGVSTITGISNKSNQNKPGVSTITSSNNTSSKNNTSPSVNNVPKVDINAAQRVIEEQKSRILQDVSKLTPFRQQVFSTIVSKSKRDYGQYKVSKDFSAYKQIQGLYNVGDFSLDQYRNFYNIAFSITDIKDPSKASYFLDLIGKAAKRQGAGITLGMANIILNIVYTSNPAGAKSPLRNVGTEPSIQKVDLQKITDAQVKSFYKNLIFKAKPIGGGRFGVIISDGERKATIFEANASDREQYRKAMEERYISQMEAKLHRTIKPLLSSSTKDFKSLEKQIREEKRIRNKKNKDN